MKHIYYAVGRKREIENFRIPVEGGTPQRVHIGPPGRGALSFDRRSPPVAFTLGDTKAETWVMEGAVPPAARAAKLR